MLQRMGGAQHSGGAGTRRDGMKNSREREAGLRHLEDAGSLTVFLALSMGIILSLLLTLIEGARRNAVKMQVELVQETAMESALSEFHRELLRQYDLLFIDTSYGTEDGSGKLLSEHLRTCMDRNFSVGGTVVPDRQTFTGIRTESVEVTGTRYAADDDCRALREQVMAYMSAEPIGETVAKVLSMADQFEGLGPDMTAWERNQKEYAGQVDEMFDTSRRRFDQRREERRTRRNRPAAGTESEESGETASDTAGLPDTVDTSDIDAEEERAESDEKTGFIRSLKNIRNDVILGWVLDSTDGLSQKETDPSVLLSHRGFRTGTGFDGVNTHHYQRADAMIFDTWLFEKCGSFCDPWKDGALSYQLEYILFGGETDRDNLSAMVMRLLLAREAVNLPCLLADGKRCREAEVLAAAVCTLLLVPEAEEAVKGLILTAWSGVESARDVETLLKGGRVPMMKHSSDWKTSLWSLVFPELASHGESGGSGVSYRDFLHIFLFLENGSTKNFRLMDVCEMDIRKTDGNSSFCMDNCLDSFGIRTVCVSSFGYRFISEGEISYN